MTCLTGVGSPTAPQQVRVCRVAIFDNQRTASPTQCRTFFQRLISSLTPIVGLRAERRELRHPSTDAPLERPNIGANPALRPTDGIIRSSSGRIRPYIVSATTNVAQGVIQYGKVPPQGARDHSSRSRRELNRGTNHTQVGRATVEVKRVRQPKPASKKSRSQGGKGSNTKTRGAHKNQRSQQKTRPGQSGKSNGQRPARRRHEEEVILPPETARKQMLVRVLPHQTQVVVMEGPVLVEHYVRRSDKESLVGNMYVGKVKNVLPGMEAAFVDFGAEKNGCCTPVMSAMTGPRTAVVAPGSKMSSKKATTCSYRWSRMRWAPRVPG